MVQRLRRLIPASATVALAVIALASTSAFAAFPLRAPQIVFASLPLQGYLNVVDVGINCLTDQLDAQTFSTSITGNTDFTLMLENGSGIGSNIGVYNGADAVPALDLIFPAAAVPGWFAALHFGGGNLTVNTFDQSSVFQGSVTYLGVNQNDFAFYIQLPAGAIRYGQDFRNPGAQALTYASNATPGDYWECFEATNPSGASSTFNSVVLNLQSVRPTPAHSSTWGKIKATYR
jgi:hypothetical protein